MIFGIAWWLFTLEILFGIGLLFTVGNEKGIMTTILTVFAGLTIWTFSGMPNLIALVSAAYTGIIFWTVAYFSIGIIWGIVNWILYTRSESMRNKIRQKFESYKNYTPNATFDDFVKSSYYPFNFATDYPKISTWVIYWPFSIVWSLTNDFLVRFVTWIGRSFSGFFAWIARGAAKDALKDDTK